MSESGLPPRDGGYPPGDFGHTGVITPDLCIDFWGSGPFVIKVAGKSYRFEDSHRFGPALVKRSGDLLANPWPSEGCPFWRAHRLWLLQGRRLEDGTCIWDEPKPQIVRHLGGRQYYLVEGGEEEGATLVRTPSGDVPIREYMRERRAGK